MATLPFLALTAREILDRNRSDYDMLWLGARLVEPIVSERCRGITGQPSPTADASGSATAHAITAHGHADTPELRNELRTLLTTEPK